MFSRILSLCKTLSKPYPLWEALTSSLSSLMFNIKNRLANFKLNIKNRLKNSDRAIHILPIGLRQRLVFVSPEKLPKETAQRFLKEIMEIKDSDARRVYRYIPFFTNSKPFLDVNTKQGFDIRKKIIPYLKPMYDDFSQDLDGLMNELQANAKAVNPKPASDLIANHVFSLMTKSIFGVAVPEKLATLLSSLEKTPASFLFGILPYQVAKILLLLSPTIRKKRKECNQYITQFFIERIESIVESVNQKKVVEKSWLGDMIKEKSENDIAFLSKKQITILANDPDIRISVAIALATTNITRTLETLLVGLYSSPNAIPNLTLELEPHFALNNDINFRKESTPLLHATYLEGLRLGAKDFGIIRKTRQPLYVNGMTIPSHSLIAFRLDAMRLLGCGSYHADEFNPTRFVNEKGELNSDSHLHEGWFAPFALGERMCPGVRITENIIKQYMLSFLERVKDYNNNTIQFFNPGESARSTTKKRLKCLIIYSMFKEESADLKAEQERCSAEIITNYLGL